MKPIAKFQQAGKELEKRLRLRTIPLAIRMLENEKEIPRGGKSPLQDFGRRLSTCQAFALSRREGLTIAAFKGDIWCPEPLIGYGIENGLPFLLKNLVGYPSVFATPEACRNWHRSLPHLEKGKYRGIVSAPLPRTSYCPEVVMIYCDPGQLTQLLIAAHWKEGRAFQMAFSGHTACIYSVVPPIKNGDYQVSLPCMGDRRNAMAQDDEIILSFPAAKLQDLLSGLRNRDHLGLGLPYRFRMVPEYPLPNFYAGLADRLGIKKSKQDRRLLEYVPPKSS
jgi:uncharacterized protein (DUF169 family)